MHGKSNAAQCYQFALVGNNGSQAALKSCSEALDGNLTRRNKAATLVNRGLLYMRKGDQEKATEDYTSALEINPGLTQAHVNQGASLIHQKKFDEAIQSLNTALEDTDSPTRAEALYNRAVALDFKEDYKGAYRDLKAALELKPDWSLALNFISRYEVRSSG